MEPQKRERNLQPDVRTGIKKARGGGSEKREKSDNRLGEVAAGNSSRNIIC